MNAELAENDEFVLFPVDNITFLCTERVTVQNIFHVQGTGYILAAGVGVPSPRDLLEGEGGRRGSPRVVAERSQGM